MHEDLNIQVERDDCAPAQRLLIIANVLATGFLRVRRDFVRLAPQSEHPDSAPLHLEASAMGGPDVDTVNAPQNGEPR